MDLLDRLLTLGTIDGYLDVRCEMHGDWSLDNDRPGQHEMPYHVLLEGSATIEGDGLAPITLQQGDVLFLPVGAPHRILDRPSAAARAGTPQAAPVIRLKPEASTTLLCGRIVLPHTTWHLYRALLPASLLIRAEDGQNSPAGSRLNRVLALLREETEEAMPGSGTVLRHLSATLFGLALRAAMLGREPPPGMLALAAHPRLSTLALRILTRIDASWTLEEMAEAANMSRSTLIRNFVAVTGIAPAEFITGLRMAEAGRQLRETELSVASIGETVGYASEAAFQRAFKRQTGFTPAAWRAQPQTASTREAPRRIATP